MYNFRNLVFEGGGVKGLAYIGALKVLEEKGIVQGIKRVGGTSAGAINAVLLALGIDLSAMEKIISELDFRKLMDDDWGILRDTHRLATEFGWHKGEYFRQWISRIVEQYLERPYATFHDLQAVRGKDLYLIGSNLSTGYSEVFSPEHTPRMPIVEAVRISMSIPFFFTAVRNTRGDVYSDGGIHRNYPIRLFDREKYIDGLYETSLLKMKPYEEVNRSKPQGSSQYSINPETLGFRLDSKEEIAIYRDGAEPPRRKINTLADYTLALVNALMRGQDDRHLEDHDWKRTVYIDTAGISSINFGLCDEDKKILIQNGIEGTRKYFEWYGSIH